MGARTSEGTRDARVSTDFVPGLRARIFPCGRGRGQSPHLKPKELWSYFFFGLFETEASEPVRPLRTAAHSKSQPGLSRELRKDARLCSLARAPDTAATFEETPSGRRSPQQEGGGE